MKKTAFISVFLGAGTMGAQMRHIQSRMIQNNMCHFVGHKQPFVWNYKPLNTPIVVKYIPFVRFSASGFTLIELIMTLAVAAILVVVAVPNMRSAIQNNRIRTLTNELISDINLARSEALKRAGNVGLCRSASGTACDGGTWHSGRVVFADTNGNMALDNNEPVLRVREAMASNTLTSAAPSPLIFNARGLPANAGNGTSFSLCDSRGTAYGRSIQISPTGQAASSSNPGSC